MSLSEDLSGSSDVHLEKPLWTYVKSFFHDSYETDTDSNKYKIMPVYSFSKYSANLAFAHIPDSKAELGYLSYPTRRDALFQTKEEAVFSATLQGYRLVDEDDDGKNTSRI